MLTCWLLVRNAAEQQQQHLPGLAQQEDEEEDDVFDPWAPLDMHDDSGMAKKPFRKAKRLPRFKPALPPMLPADAAMVLPAAPGRCSTWCLRPSCFCAATVCASHCQVSCTTDVVQHRRYALFGLQASWHLRSSSQRCSACSRQSGSRRLRSGLRWLGPRHLLHHLQSQRAMRRGWMMVATLTVAATVRCWPTVAALHIHSVSNLDHVSHPLQTGMTAGERARYRMMKRTTCHCQMQPSQVCMMTCPTLHCA